MEDRLYLLEDNAGNCMIDDHLTKQMIEKMETVGVRVTIFTPYKTLQDPHFKGKK